MVQWLRLCAPNTGGLGLSPGWGTKSHTLQLKTPCATAKPSAAKWNKCNAVGNMVPIDLLDAGLLQTLNLKNKKHNTVKQDRSMHVFWPFAHFKIKFLSIFFLLSCMHFLYILDMNPAADI